MSACQSGRSSLEDLSLPPAFAPYFRACAPSEGEVELRWERLALPPLPLEWVAQSRENWRFQAYDPIGGVLVDISSSTTSLQSSKIPREMGSGFSAKANGDIFAGGIKTGLKKRDLPCIFAGAFPSEWSELIHSREGKEGKTSSYLLSEEGRDIALRLERPAAAEERLCAMISWSQWFGLRRGELSWCITGRDRSVVLTGPDQHVLQLSR